MRTFTEYLTEATAVKTPALRKFGKEIAGLLNNVKGFSVYNETFTDYDYQTFSFRMREHDNKTNSEPLTGDEKKKLFDRVNKLIKSVSLVIGVQNVPHMNEKDVTHRGKMMKVFSYEDVKTKEGFLASMEVEAPYFGQHYADYSINIDITLKGKKSKESDTEFETYKLIAPGEIFYDSWGYSMTIVQFYQVVKRVKDQVWVKELKQTKTGGGIAGDTKALKNNFVSDTVYKGKVDKAYGENKPGIRIRLDGRLTTITHWDGRSLYYNTLD